ncbi:MAG: permease [Cyanobacteria bacterium RYN_339]|nr:permease [Cyanobacteria bacterium RYN_339]
MDRTLTVSISTRTLVIALALVGAGAALIWLNLVVALMVLAFMVASALSPTVAYFQRKGLRRGAAASLVFVLLLAAMTLFGLLVIPVLADQAQTLFSNLPGYIEKLRGNYTWLRVFDARFSWLPDFNTVRAALQARVSGWTESGVGLAGKLCVFLFLIFIVLISAFYILLDAPRLRTGLLSVIPIAHRPIWAAQMEPIGNKVGHYVRGVMLAISILVAYLAIALTLAGEPLSLVLALMAGCFELIPTLGPVLGALPAIVVALTVSWKLAVVVFLIFAFGIFVHSNFVAPLLYSAEVELPPLLITVALLVGGELMGVAGAMIAVPVLAVAVVLIENLYLAPREAEEAP